MTKQREHYLLMKRSGFDASGHYLSATDSATALFRAGFWPLFKRTPCKNQVRAGQKILIYLAGNEPDCRNVIASLTVKSIEEWNETRHRAACPIMLDDIPSLVLNISNAKMFINPVPIKEHLPKLDLVPKTNPKRWGVALMGGMKSLTLNDYTALSTANTRSLM